MDEAMAALKQLVRIGTVSSVNTAERTARVKFPHLGDMVSGNLRVMQQYGCMMEITTDLQGVHPHNHPESFTTFWMPNVGDTVLCLYLPVFNGDGIVLGVLK